MFRNLFLVFVLIAGFHQVVESYSLGFSSRTLRRYIQLAQALKYGDDCSWEAEEFRQNFTRNKIMSSGISNTIMELINTMVERNYNLCSAAELFICDKESQKCVCGDQGYEALKGVNRSLYTLEPNNKCRWDTNTYCVSEAHMAPQRQLGITVDSKCKIGTSCKLGTGEICSIEGMSRYILRTHGFTGLFNRRLITEELMSGNVCSCKLDQVVEDDSTENQIDFEDDDAEASSRRKRSISEDMELGMLAKYATGSAISI